MNKEDLIEKIAAETGLTKVQSNKTFDAIFRVFANVLSDGDSIKVPGFGSFSVKHVDQRVGRNPKTGKPIEISARKKLTFVPSSTVKGFLNNKKEKSKNRIIS